MSTTTVQEILVRMTADVADFQSKMKDSQATLSAVQSAAGNASGSISGKLTPALSGAAEEAGGASEALAGLSAGTMGLAAVVAASLGAILGFAAAMRECFEAAVPAQVAAAKLEGVVEATGEAAGLTAAEMIDLARAESRATGEMAAGIKQAQAIMATFKQVPEALFGRAIAVSGDLAKLLGHTVPQSALQLGKALEDAAQGQTVGLVALRRAGISFSEIQKEQIVNFAMTGQAAKAMELVLSVVEGQVGGVAKHMGDTWEGETAKVTNAWNDLKATIGKPLVVSAQGTGVLVDLAAVIESIRDRLAEPLTEEAVAWNRFGQTLLEAVVPALSAVGVAAESAQAWLQIIAGTLERIDRLKKPTPITNAPTTPGGAQAGLEQVDADERLRKEKKDKADKEALAQLRKEQSEEERLAKAKVAAAEQGLRDGDRLKASYESLVATYRKAGTALVGMLQAHGKNGDAAAEAVRVQRAAAEALKAMDLERLDTEREASALAVKRSVTESAGLEDRIQVLRTIAQEEANLLTAQGRSGDAAKLLLQTEEDISDAINRQYEWQIKQAQEQRTALDELRQAYLSSDAVASGQAQLDVRMEAFRAQLMAYSGLMKTLRDGFASALVDGLTAALEGKSARDAWKGFADGIANEAKSKLSAVISGALEGGGKDVNGKTGFTRALEASGLIDPSGKFSIAGALGLGGGMVSAYAQQAGNKTAGAIGGAMTGASMGLTLAGGTFGLSVIVGAIIGAIAGYMMTADAKNVLAKIKIDMSSILGDDWRPALEAQIKNYKTWFDKITAAGEEGFGNMALPPFLKQFKGDFAGAISWLSDKMTGLQKVLDAGIRPGATWDVDVSGPTQDEENILVRQMKDRYRSVAISLRGVLMDLGAELGSWPEIVKEWSVEVTDFGSWWKTFLSSELPQAVFAAMRPQLAAAFASSGDFGAGAEGRIGQELDALANATDFDAALAKFKAWFQAVKDVRAVVADLTKTMADMTEKANKGQIATWSEGFAKTLADVGKLRIDLDAMTSDEQVTNANKILELARAQVQANEQAFAALEQLRQSLTSTFKQELATLENEAVAAKGPVAMVEFAMGKLRQAMGKMSDAKTPEELQQAASDLDQWVQALKSSRQALEGWLDELDTLRESLKPLADDLAVPFEELTRRLGRTAAQVATEDFGTAIAKIMDLKAGLVGLPLDEVAGKLGTIRDLIRTQYDEQVSYLRSVMQVQQQLTQSIKGFWDSIGLSEAKKAGPVAEGNWYVEQMKAARAQMNATDDPQELARLLGEIQKYGSSLYELANSDAGKQWNLGVDTGNGTLSVLDWLKSWMPDAEEVATAKTAGQYDKIKSQLELLGDAFEGLDTVAGDAAAGLQAAIDGITATITGALGFALDVSAKSIDRWQQTIVDAGNQLAAAITDKGGILDALLSVSASLYNSGAGGGTSLGGAADDGAEALGGFTGSVTEASSAVADFAAAAAAAAVAADSFMSAAMTAAGEYAVGRTLQVQQASVTRGVG